MAEDLQASSAIAVRCDELPLSLTSSRRPSSRWPRVCRQTPLSTLPLNRGPSNKNLVQHSIQLARTLTPSSTIFGVEREVAVQYYCQAPPYVGNLGRDLDVAPATTSIQPVPGPGALGPRELLFNPRAGVASGPITGRHRWAFVLSFFTSDCAEAVSHSSGLSFPAGAYTYSHSIDNVSLQEGGGADGPVPAGSPAPQRLRAAPSPISALQVHADGELQFGFWKRAEDLTSGHHGWIRCSAGGR